MARYKVSVIVPIFMVEHFIGKCAKSLLEQTLQDVEFIFVDDDTKDKSLEILNDCIIQHPNRIEHVKLLRHKNNKGLPSARNSGLDIASGQYIFHCDSDDFVEPDMLESLYVKAVEANADIVWCDWFLSFKNDERYMSQRYKSTSEDFLRGMLAGKLKYNVWNKLIKKELYDKNNISFPDGHPLGEDMTILRLAACAQNVSYVPRALYHYVKINSNSYTSNLSEKYLSDIHYNVNETIHFILSHSKLDNILNEINFFKLEVKFPFLISKIKSDYRIWGEWYPEANDYILKNPNMSLRRKLLQFMALKKQFWFVRIHYYLVIKIIYGILYR